MKALADTSRAMLVPLGAALMVVLVWALRDVVMLVAFAVLLAYALDPLVGALCRLRLPRGPQVSRPFAAGAVVCLLVLLVLWIAVLVTPRLGAELGGFVRRIPQSLDSVLLEIRSLAADYQLSDYVDPALEFLGSNASGLIQNAGTIAASWTAKLFGGLAQLLGLAVLPVLSFYLLAEREAVQKSILRFVPEETHERLDRIADSVGRALKSYVRGQAIVCLIMGTAIAAALTVLKFPLALLLGVVAGLAEVVPFLGALIATIAIGLTGYSAGPAMAVIGVVVYIAINALTGLLVTPRVMGRHLTMHPFVVTVSILAGASLLGPAGALLALPGTAVLQAVVQTLAPGRNAGGASASSSE